MTQTTITLPLIWLSNESTCSSLTIAGRHIGYAMTDPEAKDGTWTAISGVPWHHSRGYRTQRDAELALEAAVLAAIGVRSCQTCDGRGEVGGFVGSIGSGAEGYQTDPCPDCGGGRKADAARLPYGGAPIASMDSLWPVIRDIIDSQRGDDNPSRVARNIVYALRRAGFEIVRQELHDAEMAREAGDVG